VLLSPCHVYERRCESLLDMDYCRDQDSVVLEMFFDDVGDAKNFLEKLEM